MIINVVMAAITNKAIIEAFSSGVILGGTLYSVAKTKKSPSKLK